MVNTLAATILLVEDDPAARIVTKDILQRAGYIVQDAADGETALRLLQNHVFDIVVTDIRMRVVDGLQVLESARQMPYLPEVILLTGYGSMETAVAALRRGAYDYLMKPCPPHQLVECVARAVQHHREQQRQAGALQAILDIASRARDKETPAITPILASLTVGQVGQVGQMEPPPANDPLTAETNRYLRVGNLTLDVYRHRVLINDEPLRVTQIEYELLHCLAIAQGRVLTYREIARHTHHQEMDESEARTLLKQHVRNLRNKIGNDYVINIRGIGYMLVDPHDPTSQRFTE
jgi:DNA-binding response OmpR family regulator